MATGDPPPSWWQKRYDEWQAQAKADAEAKGAPYPPGAQLIPPGGWPAPPAPGVTSSPPADEPDELDELLNKVATTILSKTGKKPSWQEQSGTVKGYFDPKKGSTVQPDEFDDETVAKMLDIPVEHVQRYKSMGHKWVKPTEEGGFSFHKPEDNPNLGAQFKGYTGGPEEARQKAGQEEDEDYPPMVSPTWAQHPQGVLIPDAPEQTTVRSPSWAEQLGVDVWGGKGESLLEAHHQTPEQFANDPRTWWHGRYTKTGRVSDLPPEETSGEGFHSGTKQSAEERLSHRYPSEIWPGHQAHMYPLRITGPVIGTHNIHMDVGYHSGLGGPDARGRPGYLYHNESEDTGSVSLGTPNRQDFLSTHKEMVQKAQEQGKYVHPLIQWAVENHPEHTGGPWVHPNIREQEEKYRDMDTGQSPGQMSMFDSDEYEQNAARTSFRTAGGETVHVVKMHTHPTLGKQWQTTTSQYEPEPEWGKKQFHDFQGAI